MHRVYVFGKHPVEVEHLVGHGEVRLKLLLKALKLPLRRQVVVPEKVDDLFKRSFIGQLADVVAAVDQFAFLPVDVANFGDVDVDAVLSRGGWCFPCFLLVNCFLAWAQCDKRAHEGCCSSLSHAIVPFSSQEEGRRSFRLHRHIEVAVVWEWRGRNEVVKTVKNSRKRSVHPLTPSTGSRRSYSSFTGPMPLTAFSSSKVSGFSRANCVKLSLRSTM